MVVTLMASSRLSEGLWYKYIESGVRSAHFCHVCSIQLFIGHDELSIHQCLWWRCNFSGSVSERWDNHPGTACTNKAPVTEPLQAVDSVTTDPDVLVAVRWISVLDEWNVRSENVYKKLCSVRSSQNDPLWNTNKTGRSRIVASITDTVWVVGKKPFSDIINAGVPCSFRSSAAVTPESKKTWNLTSNGGWWTSHYIF